MNKALNTAALALCALVTMFASPVLNGAERTWNAGSEYKIVQSGNGLKPNEVVEFFSYACVHCYNFQANMDRIETSLPNGVSLRLVPVVLADSWEPFARAFYAAESLGVAKRTHSDAFKYVIGTLRAKGTVEDMAAFYQKYGVDPAAFEKIAESDQITMQLQRDREMYIHLGLEGTPTIAVGSQYLTGDVGSYEEMESLVYWLEKKSGMR